MTKIKLSELLAQIRGFAFQAGQASSKEEAAIAWREVDSRCASILVECGSNEPIASILPP